MKIIPVGNDFALAMKLKAVKAEVKKEVVNGNITKPASVSPKGDKPNEQRKTQEKVGGIEKKIPECKENEEKTDKVS